MKLSKAITLSLIMMAPLSATAEENVVGIFGGHHSKHLISKDTTNEEHAWVSLRYNQFIIGRFDNSYKQDGFSGESYHIGLVKDFTVSDVLDEPIFDNLGGWNGRTIVRVSGGLMYGYTMFAGHDQSSKNLTPYVAGGAFYQQPLGAGVEVEAGLMLLGDALLPSVGILHRF